MSALSEVWAAITSSSQIKSLTQKVDKLMTTSAQLVTDLNAVTAKVSGLGAKVEAAIPSNV